MDGSDVRGEIGEGRSAVSAAWIAPIDPVAWLVVAHGAGAGMDHPFVVGFCHAMADHGVATVRFNFHYMSAGRRSPDAEASLRSAWQEAFAGTVRLAGGLPVLAGGKSLGGRIASMCVADGMAASGLLFLGYPLHPPGKPERLRAEHLERISVPMLFLQGTRDPFAEPGLLAAVLEPLGERAVHVQIEGGDHSFNLRGRKVDPHDVGAGLARHAGPFVRQVAGAD